MVLYCIVHLWRIRNAIGLFNYIWLYVDSEFVSLYLVKMLSFFCHLILIWCFIIFIESKLSKNVAIIFKMWRFYIFNWKMNLNGFCARMSLCICICLYSWFVWDRFHFFCFFFRYITSSFLEQWDNCSDLWFAILFLTRRDLNWKSCS